MFSMVYDELRQLASYKLANQPPGQTLQPTALVHDAFVKLSKSGGKQFNDREHFFACVAEAMRQILVDAARRKKAVRHGGQHKRLPLAEDLIVPPYADDDLLCLDEALGKLAAQDEKLGTVVKLRCFAGMTNVEIGEAMDLSRRQVDRLWAYARAYLYRELDSKD